MFEQAFSWDLDTYDLKDFPCGASYKVIQMFQQAFSWDLQSQDLKKIPSQ